MDSRSAFARGDAARAVGARLRVFDWDKAATLIVERGARKATAGLKGDWEWTGGTILRDGRPLDENKHCFLASIWATPQVYVDGEVIDCWRYEDDTPGWDEDTFWPESARAILDGGRSE